MSNTVVMIFPLRAWVSVYAIVLLAATSAGLAGCSSCGERVETGKEHAADKPSAQSQSEGPRDEPVLLARVKPMRPEVHRGICIAHNYQRGGSRGYGTQTSQATLRELKALGATWVSLTPFGFMASTSASEVRAIGNFKAGETDERMAREIAAARELGFRVLLKPHIWIHNGAWRGEINPKEGKAWDAWFASYQTWIVHYAKLAERTGVDVLTVGVELDHTARRFEDKWRELLRRVREVFSGKLVYSANWDRVNEVSWWDALDFIGVQFYPPIAETKNDTADAMSEKILGRLDKLAGLSKGARRPLLLTEVGYRSAEGATLQPFKWPERAKARVDLEEQARAYFALLHAVRRRPEVAGVYWWKWFTDPETREEGRDGFSPRGKPAEALLRAAFRNGL